MSMKRALFIGLFAVLLSQLVFGVVYADNASVLPKGVSRVSISSNLYLPTEKRFNPDGDVEDVAMDYNTTLNSSVFSALSLVELAFGLPAGSANVGNSVVSFEYDFNVSTVTFDHGVTDRLTVGIIIPYMWVENKVSANLDTTSASVGKNVVINSLAPLTFPGTVPLTTEDVQDLLGNGLDINGDGTIDIAGFGLKRFETWSDNGVNDILVGFRYQYHKTKDWQLALTSSVKLPTGEVDDPDSLVDYGLGIGTHTILFYLNNDYTGIDRLVLDATLKYELALPDKETKRVPSDVNLPITSDKEKVDRNIGDLIELELSGQYALLDGFNVSLLYNYSSKMKDKISGDNPLFTYDSLEAETDATSQHVVAGLSYTTVPMYMQKKFPVPLTASISYRNRFAGSNNVFKSQYVGLGLQVFF